MNLDRSPPVGISLDTARLPAKDESALVVDLTHEASLDQSETPIPGSPGSKPRIPLDTRREGKQEIAETVQHVAIRLTDEAEAHEKIDLGSPCITTLDNAQLELPTASTLAEPKVLMREAPHEPHPTASGLDVIAKSPEHRESQDVSSDETAQLSSSVIHKVAQGEDGPAQFMYQITRGGEEQQGNMAGIEGQFSKSPHTPRARPTFQNMSKLSKVSTRSRLRHSPQPKPAEQISLSYGSGPSEEDLYYLLMHRQRQRKEEVGRMTTRYKQLEAAHAFLSQQNKSYRSQLDAEHALQETRMSGISNEKAAMEEFKSRFAKLKVCSMRHNPISLTDQSVNHIDVRQRPQQRP